MFNISIHIVVTQKERNYNKEFLSNLLNGKKYIKLQQIHLYIYI